MVAMLNTMVGLITEELDLTLVTALNTGGREAAGAAPLGHPHCPLIAVQDLGRRLGPGLDGVQVVHGHDDHVLLEDGGGPGPQPPDGPHTLLHHYVRHMHGSGSRRGAGLR